MNLILDTHSFLWFVANDARLSHTARTMIESPANQKWLSLASCWEIAIKAGLGKLRLVDPVEVFLPEQIAANHFSLLSIELSHVLRVAGLPSHHRDPFDRLIIAQSLVESYRIVGIDVAFDAYGITRVW